MPNPRYRELEVWQDAMELSLKTYKYLESFPSSEKFGLIDQIKRCVVSIPSNIAEGAGRSTFKDFTHFLYIARGSLFELSTQLELSYNLGIGDKEQNEVLQSSIDSIGKKLHNLIKFNKAKS